MNLYVGCAKWNRTDLKNFYPRGTKDELDYYASQFNCIELNATFYRIFPKAQFEKWREKTPDGFRFFPKVSQNVSHWGRLKDVEKVVDEVVHAFEGLEEKLGRAFLQMTENFSPKDFDRVVSFVEYWPKHTPLAMEFRHTDWYNDPAVAGELYSLLEAHNIANVITDTAGRRDLLHMRLTTPSAFIRYTGANHPSDRTRLDDWIDRLVEWDSLGIREVDFFVHQNMELESPLLAAYFIGRMNERLGLGLKVPATLSV
jgi:uncharacterized protein YecE (DUF72 family)